MKMTKELKIEKARKQMTVQTKGLKEKVKQEIKDLLKELQDGTLDARTLELRLCEMRRKVAEMPNHEV
jgi:DNA-binding protein Fis